MQKEVERIYELTKSLNMVVIDCDVINHPSQLTDCSLAPISIYIKMEPQILEKLVKLRGSKRKNLGAQVVAAQKLAQCNEVSNSLKLYLQRNSFVTQRYMLVTQRYKFVTQSYISRYVHTIPDSFSCQHERAPSRYSMNTYLVCDFPALEIDRRGVDSRSITEISSKSPFLRVNRSPIRHAFRAGAKATWYSVNIA